MSKIKNIEVWKEAKKRYHLTDIHIQMARDLGLNPKNLEAWLTINSKNGRPHCLNS